MGEKTTLPISKNDLNELRLQLEALRRELDYAPADDEDPVDTGPLDRICDLFFEAIHCPPNLTWLNPAAQEA